MLSPTAFHPAGPAESDARSAADFLLDIEEENAEMNAPEEGRSVLSRRSGARSSTGRYATRGCF